MDNIEKCIAAYRRASFEDDGESAGKIDAIDKLADHLDDPRVLNFFIEVFTDHDEYDLARTEIFKLMQLWSPPDERERRRIGRKLAKVIPVDDDVLVQQWAAIAAENFIQVPEVLKAVSEVITDPEADLDVRHNCLGAIERLQDSEKAEAVLRGLLNDSQLGKFVKRILSDRRKRP